MLLHLPGRDRKKLASSHLHNSLPMSLCPPGAPQTLMQPKRCRELDRGESNANMPGLPSACDGTPGNIQRLSMWHSSMPVPMLHGHAAEDSLRLRVCSCLLGGLAPCENPPSAAWLYRLNPAPFASLRTICGCVCSMDLASPRRDNEADSEGPSKKFRKAATLRVHPDPRLPFGAGF